MGGCIRFSSEGGPIDASVDAPYDGPKDVSRDITIEGEAGAKADASDASLDGVDATVGPTDVSAEVPPTCQRFDPAIANAVASDVVSALLQDCRIRSAFASLPPVRLEHFEECFAAQVASVLGCVHPDGTRFKYPAFDTNGQFCRDMKTAHADLAPSDGDFDAFLAAISFALAKNGLTTDEIARAMRTYGAGPTRADIVKLKDAGPTRPCDAGPMPPTDSSVESGPDASASDASEASAVAAPRDGSVDGSMD
jgi:hypothetical protein